MEKRKFTTIKGGMESFASIQEFFLTLAKRPDNSAFSRRNKRASITGSKSFTGTESFEQAQDIMRHGYKEGAKDLMQCKTAVTIQNPAKRIKTFADVCGFAPIVPNAIIGIPQSMINARPQVKQAKVIDILMDVDVDCSVDKSVLTKGGKNIYSLVKTLELKGIRVNLSLVSLPYSYDDSNLGMMKVKIKDSKQAINPQLIAYPIIHPSFLRRHVFRWTEQSEFTNYVSYCSGYGYVGRNYLTGHYGSVMRFLIDNKVANKDTYYIDVETAAYAENMKDLMQRLGIVA